MLQRAKNSWRKSGSDGASSGASEAQLLEELRQQVSEATLAGLAGSSDLPSGGAVAAEVDAVLLRHLRAEKLSVPKAAKRLEAQAAWRQQFGSVSEEEIAIDLELAKVIVQPPTASSSGRPLLVVKACRHRPGNLERIQKYIVYCLDAASHYSWETGNPDGKFVAVFDLSGLQLKNLDAAALRAAFALLSQHFPERISMIFMYDAPTIFWGLWKVVEPFIDRVSRQKIQFVNGKAGHKAIVEALSSDVVPVEYGGSAAEVPVEQAVQQLAAWRQQQQLGRRTPAKRAAEATVAGEQQEVQATGEGALGWHALRMSKSSPTLMPAAASSN